MQEFCKLWKISLTFRCAHKPSGNGITGQLSECLLVAGKALITAFSGTISPHMAVKA